MGCSWRQQRLAGVVGGADGGTPEGVVEAVDAAVREHLAGRPPADDYTLVAVRFGK